jgi:uncharacterized glyoxalase superfamily protein PhnB
MTAAPDRLSYPEQTLSLAALAGRDLVDSSLTIDPWGLLMTTPLPAPEKFHGATAVSLTVQDIHKSADWYQNVVGFGVGRTFEHEGRLVFVELKAGDVRLNLNQDDGAKGWDRVKGLGFSINIWTTEDIDAIANRIKASGGTLDSEPVDAPWGARYFRLTDPDGFKLAVLKSLP